MLPVQMKKIENPNTFKTMAAVHRRVTGVLSGLGAHENVYLSVKT